MATEVRARQTPEALLARWRAVRDRDALAALFDATATELFRTALAIAHDGSLARKRSRRRS